ncbi:MAG: hypothetical protein R6V34_12080 [Bacteroidales bacterium]
MIKYITAISLILIIFSCTRYESGGNRTAVAYVGDSYLYADQIPVRTGNGITEEDSISIARNYIERWVRNQLILDKAEVNLSEEYQQEIDNKLEETRANLMIYQYEQQMMLQKMDTAVSEQEIVDYYDNHTQNFNLQNSIVKILFLKLPGEAPNIERAKAWFRSDKQGDLQNLESYAYQFADKFDDFGERWVSINIMLRELPEEIDDITQFLRNNQYYESSDSSYYYFVNIRDFRLSGAVAPIEYVREDIKTIIINNRKIGFLQELENGIYNEGIKENSFRILQ